MTEKIEENKPLGVALPKETSVREFGTDNELLLIDGLLLLPIGAHINIDNNNDYSKIPINAKDFPDGRADAVVVGTRLWGTTGRPQLILEVELKLPF